GAIPDRSTAPGKKIAIQVTASDPDAGQSLTFSLGKGAPPGASVDRRTGVLTWTPTTPQAGHSYTFPIVVTDDGTPALAASRTVATAVLAPPRIVKVVRSRVKSGTRSITLVFNVPMDPRTAAVSSQYVLLTSKVPRGPVKVPVSVTARYNPAARSVVLTL